jgi:hypothetical protein
MDITRREFLGYTAGGAISVVGLPLPEPTPGATRLRTFGKWCVFGTSGPPWIPESALGYHAALPEERQRYDLRERIAVSSPSLLIYPSLLVINLTHAAFLTNCMKRGATVVIESGAGFMKHFAFRRHRRQLRERLQIPVAAPVDLWSHGSRPSTPYVEYTWPRRARIRDFSRVVPPGEQPGEIIAWAGELPVAFKRRVGAGTLIYLGSPVGPALWAGDLEAKRWLHAVALTA